MDFGDYVRLVRRSAWLIVALVLIGIVVMSGMTLRESPLYASTTSALVSGRGATVGDANQANAISSNAAMTLANVATSSYILNQVATDRGRSETSGQLAVRISAMVPANSNEVVVTANGASATDAADLANAVMKRLNDSLSNLLPGSNSRAVALHLTTLDPAVPSGSALSPKPGRNLALGALAGLILGLIIAVLRQLLDNRITTLRDLERTTDAPLLGQFLKDEEPPRSMRTEAAFAGSGGAEAFRTLRTNLRYLEGPAVVGSFVVTSPDGQEDRTELAANLAIAMADLGGRVVVVDADLRRSSLARYLGVRDDLGLTDVLLRQVRLSEALQVWNRTNLSVLPAGTPTDNPNELIQSEPMPALVERLQLEFDTVIFNTPPLLAASDAAIIATYTSGAIVVCEMGRTSRSQLVSALTALDRVGSSVLGLIAAGLRESGPSRYTRQQRRPLSRAVLRARSAESESAPVADDLTQNAS